MMQGKDQPAPWEVFLWANPCWLSPPVSESFLSPLTSRRSRGCSRERPAPPAGDRPTGSSCGTALQTSPRTGRRWHLGRPGRAGYWCCWCPGRRSGGCRWTSWSSTTRRRAAPCGPLQSCSEWELRSVVWGWSALSSISGRNRLPWIWSRKEKYFGLTSFHLFSVSIVFETLVESEGLMNFFRSLKAPRSDIFKSILWKWWYSWKPIRCMWRMRSNHDCLSERMFVQWVMAHGSCVWALHITWFGLYSWILNLQNIPSYWLQFDLFFPEFLRRQYWKYWKHQLDVYLYKKFPWSW